MPKNKVENIVPYGETERKGSQIKRMFDKIASRYDIMNRFISLNCDKRWRNIAIGYIKGVNHDNIIDIATGTGDMAVMLHHKLKPVSVTGCDISDGMLEIARKKVVEKGLSEKISFTSADCTALPFSDASFDVATVAFGIRNFEDLSLGLTEIRRVLKPGGMINIIELSVPENNLYKLFFTIYTRTVIPLLGKLLTKDKGAYKYLRLSIEAVPQGKSMKSLMEQAGFKDCIFEYLTFGVCAIYVGTTPD